MDDSVQLATKNRGSDKGCLYERADDLIWLFEQQKNSNGKNLNINLRNPVTKLIRKIVNYNISYGDKKMLIGAIIESCQAQYSAKNKIIAELSSDFWYSTGMGCKEETFDVMQQASQVDQDFLRSAQTSFLDSFEIVLRQGAIQDDSKLAVFDLYQSTVNNKPILIVTNKGEILPRYVAYNGAIASVKQPRQCDYMQFSAWGNIESQKQAQVLAKAASSFPFDLFDEQGICIIGNGEEAPKFYVKQQTDDVIEDFYPDKFFNLKKEGNLNVQEILKLMPKYCMLSINPYIQDGGMLYSIVCEWISADNTRWQIEIHSQDMNWHADDEWIFRFGKEKGGDKKYFRIAKDNSSYDFNGEFSGDDAHIRIDSPLQNDDLLNSVQFQKEIRQKSVDLYTDFEIGEIIDELGISGRNQTEKKYNLVDYCLKNPLVFAKYKDEILKLRANLGMVELI